MTSERIKAEPERPPRQARGGKDGNAIPRRKNSNGTEGGPYVIPPGAQHIPGRHECETCGRMVKTDSAKPRKGSCKCLYYKRTTTFIDVLQDEYLLKQWGNRNVVWGMGQRPDLVLHAASCKSDSDYDQTAEDKTELNNIAAEAQSTAGDKTKARIGTSLHKLTHQKDRGETLGYVPERWVDDLKAYDAEMKRLGVEWVSIESFRVLDTWVKPIGECDHKAPRYGGACECMGVAGTVDRLGWYRGRLRVFDIKSGSDFNKLGHTMQLVSYAKMVPYVYPGDERGEDPDEVDTDVGYIIWLPEGQGQCKIEPMDLQKGWRACLIAKQVWEARNWSVHVDRDPRAEVTEMALRAGSVEECRILWFNALEAGVLDKRLKTVIRARAAELEAKKVSA